MKIKAAILWERGTPLSVEDADLDPPGAGEVLVEVKAAGVCHSDLHPARGDWPTTDHPLAVVEHRSLAGRQGPLGNVEVDARLVTQRRDHGGGLGRV